MTVTSSRTIPTGGSAATTLVPEKWGESFPMKYTQLYQHSTKISDVGNMYYYYCLG